VNAEAAEGTANVLKLDPDWSAERDISDTGAFARQAELDLYLDRIRKAGLPSAHQRQRYSNGRR
jgi:hypothetical protein